MHPTCLEWLFRLYASRRAPALSEVATTTSSGDGTGKGYCHGKGILDEFTFGRGKGHCNARGDVPTEFVFGKGKGLGKVELGVMGYVPTNPNADYEKWKLRHDLFWSTEAELHDIFEPISATVRPAACSNRRN